MDELARELGIDPFELRRRNVDRARRPDRGHRPRRGERPRCIGSYGLDQCLDLVERRCAAPGGDVPPAPAGDWAIGTGMALAMIATMPPRGHFADTHRRAAARRRLRASASAPPSSATAPRPCTPSSSRPRSARRPTASRIRQSDTDVAALRHRRVRLGRGRRRGQGAARAPQRELATACSTARVRRPRLASRLRVRERLRPRPPLDGAATAAHADGSHDGTPRSVAFNVHGFRVAVDRATGEVRILQLGAGRRRRHRAQPRAAARPGRGRHRPGDRHGALRGGDARRRGRVTTTAFRNYHMPQFADVPRTEVLLRRHARRRSARSAPSR